MSEPSALERAIMQNRIIAIGHKTLKNALGRTLGWSPALRAPVAHWDFLRGW
jgi:hypothetical protein